MSPVHAIDVCGLPPPEPIMRILDALRILPPDGSLHVHIHREPYPLYRLLEREGYAWTTSARADGTYDLTIWCLG